MYIKDNNWLYYFFVKRSGLDLKKIAFKYLTFFFIINNAFEFNSFKFKKKSIFENET